jgi:LysR family hydrogen peroxide-inducible transcriptional activator
MTTKVYEYMLAIRREGNLSKAAEKCYISQPALSQHVKTLEKKLNCTLFRQENGRMIPTRAGEIFLITADRIVQTEQETKQKLAALRARGDHSSSS